MGSLFHTDCNDGRIKRRLCIPVMLKGYEESGRVYYKVKTWAILREISRQGTIVWMIWRSWGFPDRTQIWL